jgi:ribosomal protein L11 methyltransferase
MRIFFEEGDPRPALEQALETVGVKAEIFEQSIADEDWKFAYRRHFKTELVSPRILVQPEWEDLAVIKFDPGLAFGTGKHETTKASLQYIDELSDEMRGASFLDMGSGSGILSIAAAKLGYTSVRGFDIDSDAVDASVENAQKNSVDVEFFKYALGSVKKRDLGVSDLVVANILGPLLIRFAGEIAPCVGKRLVISGILNEFYPEVLAAYEKMGFEEISRKTIGEWTTGLLKPVSKNTENV